MRKTSQCDGRRSRQRPYNEQRLNAQLAEVSVTTPMSSGTPQLPPAPEADPALVRSTEKRPSTGPLKQKPTKPLKNPQLSFSALSKSAQDQLIYVATQDLPPDFNYQTHSKYQIQIKTDTPHITQKLRAHLFDLAEDGDTNT